jgi:UPF0716 protein FxsA
MVSRLLFVYAVVELAAIFGLVWALGWGWTLLILLATFVLGWGLLAPMAGSQLLHQLRGMRSGSTEPRRLGDGALVTVATGLVLIPGLVTTVIGTLLLLPPVRAAAGPGVTSFALRTLQRRVPLVSYPAAFARTHRGYAADGRDYIDGEVIDVQDDVHDDVHDVEPPALRGDDHWGGPRYASGSN